MGWTQATSLFQCGALLCPLTLSGFLRMLYLKQLKNKISDPGKISYHPKAQLVFRFYCYTLKDS